MMRVEPSGIGEVQHVIKRGARGTDIVRDEADRKRFVRSLFYLNDAHSDPYWHERIAVLSPFERPRDWPEREPLVGILSWTLLSNHFHIVARELVDGGIAKFMQRLCGSMTMCFNAKYEERGSLFQGSYRSRLVKEDEYLRYLTFYVEVKNVLDMYPGGLHAAMKNFSTAWQWATLYPYSSLRNHVAGDESPILSEHGLICEYLGNGKSYEKDVKELLESHLESKGELFGSIMLERW